MTRPIIDLHAHFLHPDLPLLTPVGVDPRLPTVFGTPEFHEKVTRIETVISALDNAGIAVRALNAPPSTYWADGAPPEDAIRRVNDWIAENVQRYPDRLAGFASINAFAGEAGAREVDRAIGELGLDGIVIDSAQGPDTFIGAEHTLPALGRAAALGVPVFLHPASGAFISALGSLGRPRVLLDRGTANAAALLNLLEKEVFERIPELVVIATALGAGALVTAAQSDLNAVLRPEGHRPVYFDAMTFKPDVIAFLVRTLGADRVVVGTDSPIVSAIDAQGIIAALDAAGLTDAQKDLVTSGNAARLLPHSNRFALAA